MRIPVIHGVIDRRILANYHVDPDAMARILPPPFRPKLANGYAIGGICLIRLKNVRPRFFPLPWGIRSENAAHRFAVEWDVDGRPHEGVYIPRRDTDSRLNTLAGGTIFPGIHHHASFTVKEFEDYFLVAMQSDDGNTRLHVSGTVTDDLPGSSVFSSVADASDFFETGSLGYSTTQTDGRYDGLELRCQDWHVEPLEVEKIETSFFADELRFPRGSVEFDCALLMRNIPHEWRGHKDLCCHATNEHNKSLQTDPRSHHHGFRPSKDTAFEDYQALGWRGPLSSVVMQSEAVRKMRIEKRRRSVKPQRGFIPKPRASAAPPWVVAPPRSQPRRYSVECQAFFHPA